MQTSVQILKYFDGNFVFFLLQFSEKLEKNYGEKCAIIGIDIDVDTREKYRYLSIPESIDTFPSLNKTEMIVQMLLFNTEWLTVTDIFNEIKHIIST